MERKRGPSADCTPPTISSAVAAAAVVAPFGPGANCATGFDLGQDSAQARSVRLRRFVNDLARAVSSTAGRGARFDGHRHWSRP